MRRGLIVLHDLAMTAFALLATIFVRFETRGVIERLDDLLFFLPFYLIYAGFVYRVFELYRTKWRFASLPDLFNIFKASLLLSATLIFVDWVLVSSRFYNELFFGKISVALYSILQIVFLVGPRIAYRYYRYVRTRVHARAADSVPVLLVGRASDADVFLRAVESGAVQKMHAAGILSPSEADRGQSIRGVPVLGTLSGLDAAIVDAEQNGASPTRLILMPSAFDQQGDVERLIARAKRRGLTTGRLPSLEGGRTLDGAPMRIAPIDVEDLLLRSKVTTDVAPLQRFVGGRRALVTGGGGSIGAEICERLATLGVGHVTVFENSEVALHAIVERLAVEHPELSVEGVVGDVRDRDRVLRVFEAVKPDVVFHAAALKHVPILEAHWQEGVKTNVFGSVNVVDASVKVGAAVLVIISTDKAIEPVSILGATKRVAEMYGQAHDRDFSAPPSAEKRTRIISVRFGNVLASSGSVIPKFKSQIEAGGPVTVTHRDMVRYFMTVQEATTLVITAGMHALQPVVPPVSVYVLNMGEPVRIQDIAERLILLAGLEPGRDIEIKEIGARPGERLEEILFAEDEPVRDIGVPGVMATHTTAPGLAVLRGWLADLDKAVKADDRVRAEALLGSIVPKFAATHPARGPVVPSATGDGSITTGG